MDFRLLRKVIEGCSSVFRETDRFFLPQQAIVTVIERVPQNRTVPAALAKASLINNLYGTAIRNLNPIAIHIVENKLDRSLASGDIDVVNKIRHGHGLKLKRGKEIDLYSFATKYAHFHNPMAFPMYDNLIMRLLHRINKSTGFRPGLTQIGFRDYSIYKCIIDALARATGFEHRLYREFDQGLWVYSKYKFIPQGLYPSEKALIESRLPIGWNSEQI